MLPLPFQPIARSTFRKNDLVILPAFNESRNLPPVLADIARALPNVDALVVDDGSYDGTDRVARECGAYVVRHPFNLGYGAALQSGYRYALEHGYLRVAQMDSDGQHRPEDVARMLEILSQENESVGLVLGSRFMPESGPYPMPLVRQWGQAYMRSLVQLLTGTRFADPTTGLEAMRRSVLRLFAQDVFPHDYPDADVLVMLHRAGIHIAQMPASMRPRVFGSSMHSGFKWAYYLFRMTLSLLVITLGKGFDRLRAEAQNEVDPLSQASGRLDSDTSRHKWIPGPGSTSVELNALSQLGIRTSESAAGRTR